MSSQQSRPAWFRLSALTNRAPAPTPAPAPAPARPPVLARPPAPAPVVRPVVPTRPSSPPTRTQELAPPPVAASPPPRSPPFAAASPPPRSPPFAAASPPPRSPSAAAASPPPRSPPAAAAPLSPPPMSITPSIAPTRSPVARVSPPVPTPLPPRSSPPRVPLAFTPQSPALPPPATKSPLKNSPVRRETFTTSSHASPPSPQTKLQPNSFVSNGANENASVNAKPPTPLSSPKIVRTTPTQSPIIKPSSHPSPFTLPPAQVKEDDNQHEPKIHQKSVLVQDKPMSKPRDHISITPANKKEDPVMNDKSTSKKMYNSSEYGMSVIALTGDNKGAVMEFNPHTSQKNRSIISATSNGDQSGIKTGKEGKSDNKDKTNRSMTTLTPVKATINSNVQGLNNSILVDCTFKTKAPGVHFTHTKTSFVRDKDTVAK